MARAALVATTCAGVVALGCGLGDADPERAALEALCGPSDQPVGAWVTPEDPAEITAADACFDLGLYWGDEDPELARRYYLVACGKGVENACHNLGVMAGNGDGGEADPAMAAAAYTHACDLGFTASCGPAGDAWRGGIGVQTDHDRARSLFAAGCEARDGPSCLGLGNLLGDGERPDDITAANEAWRRACDLGSDAGCYNLATSKRTGRGMTPDPSGALQDLRASCAAGYARACGAAGELLWRGDDVPGDDAVALELFGRGCHELSDAVSCLRLGDAYAGGRGVPADPAKAEDYHRRACEHGYRPACDG